MSNENKTVLRIDCNYAIVQALYWAAYCSLGAFATIYLTYRGLGNTWIGITTSVSSVYAIVIQIFVSDFCDRHEELPIKHVISVLFLISIGILAVVHWLPVPVLMVVLLYSLVTSLPASVGGFLNAEMMQYNNVGIPAHYGWPRGVGSVSYAFAAMILGNVAEKYSPGVLPYIYIIGSIICLISNAFMPDPNRLAAPMKKTSGQVEYVTYGSMLKHNRKLRVFLICVALYALGQAGSFTFMIRIIENLGGGAKEYGIYEFVRAGVEVPMLLFSGWFLLHMSEKKLLTVSFLASAVRIIMIGFAPNMFVVYLAAVSNLVVSGIYIFASVVYANGIVGVREKVRAQALAGLTYSAGAIVGNTLAGILLDIAGLSTMFLVSSVFCVLAGVIFLMSKE